MDFSTLSESQLNTLIDGATAELKSRRAARKARNLDARLVQVELNELEGVYGLWLQPSFVKKMSTWYVDTTWPNTRYYARTKTGILWSYSFRHRKWFKHQDR